MDSIGESGYLKIGNETDRTTVATILFKNGYTVRPVRFKKNGKAYEYYVKYERMPVDESEGSDLK